MTTLHDRLADLADDAPSGSPPGDLWPTGRRIHRRRRAGTTVIVVAALALLGGLAGVSWTQSRMSVEPAGSTTQLGLPDQIYATSPHLRGTGETGPIGPLVAVVPTIRESWLGNASNGLLGISATGAYAFLDLPHLADVATFPTAPALSADGQFIAYWRAGQPDGSPGDPDGDPVTGVAVYDTTTGDTFEYDVDTEHGLQAESMLWVGHRLSFDVWQLDAPRDDGMSASFTQQVVWDPVTDFAGVTDADASGLDGASAWRDSLVLVKHDGQVVRRSPEGNGSFGRFVEAPSLGSPLFVSDDGSRAAAQVDNDSTGRLGPVVVAPLGNSESDRLSLTKVQGTADNPVDDLLGWRDESHVVFLDYSGGTGEARLASLDVDTGDRATLGYVEGNQPVLAVDALTGPVFDGPQPPHPLDPRLVYGGGAVIVLAAGLAIVWWRRRAQR